MDPGRNITCPALNWVEGSLSLCLAAISMCFFIPACHFCCSWLRARNCAVAQYANGLCTPGTSFAPQNYGAKLVLWGHCWNCGVVVGIDFIGSFTFERVMLFAPHSRQTTSPRNDVITAVSIIGNSVPFPLPSLTMSSMFSSFNLRSVTHCNYKGFFKFAASLTAPR